MQFSVDGFTNHHEIQTRTCTIGTKGLCKVGGKGSQAKEISGLSVWEMRRKKDTQKSRTKRQHRDGRQNESRGTHPQPAPAAPSGDNAHVFFPSYPLISHRAHTLPRTFGRELQKLWSPATDNLVSRPQLLSERTLNTFPPKLQFEHTRDHTELLKPRQNHVPHRRHSRKRRNATVCSCEWLRLYTFRLKKSVQGRAGDTPGASQHLQSRVSL